MISVYPIRAYSDNYIWCIVNDQTKRCVIVDPGESGPVFQFLQTHQMIPSAVLITHHHYDHTDGVAEILKYFDVPVYGSHESQFHLITEKVKEGDSIQIDQFDFQVMETPGHTLDHLVYYNDQWAFTGDTLFLGGCGGLFEGTVDQLYNSLVRISNLPDNILIYCAHEYTALNLRFAMRIEPNNQALIDRYKAVKIKLLQGQSTVPDTLAIEKETNPFFRCHLPSVRNSVEEIVGRKLETPLEVFAELRGYKSR